MATYPRIDLSHTATLAQAEFDRQLEKIVFEERNKAIPEIRWDAGLKIFYQLWKPQNALKEYQQDCLRVEDHECKRPMGLHVGPKRELKEWEQSHVFEWEEWNYGYEWDDDVNIIQGDSNPLVCPDCEGSKRSRRDREAAARDCAIRDSATK